jgi:hypothetical protein
MQSLATLQEVEASPTAVTVLVLPTHYEGEDVAGFICSRVRLGLPWVLPSNYILRGGCGGFHLLASKVRFTVGASIKL